MSYITILRDALSGLSSAKDASRAAGEGMWANYVRSTCWPVVPENLQEFEQNHTALMEKLEQIRELSKDEKNSVRSAKSVVGKAIQRGVSPFKTDERGYTETNEDGDPMVKGKSELQEAKSDFERLIGLLDNFDKVLAKESRDTLTADELASLKARLIESASNVMGEMQ